MIKYINKQGEDVNMDSSYLFNLDYGNRVKEKDFILDVLHEFDASKITGCSLIVNNNPYNFEFYFFINFQGDTGGFDKWLKNNYPTYARNKRKYNYFLSDAFHSMGKRGYQIFSVDEFMMEIFLTKEANKLFLFPDKETMCEMWKGGLRENIRQAFLCHSSVDKNIVDDIFDNLQKRNINAFYDKHGIKAGQSIREIINENLHISDTCILCVSENLNYEESEWIKHEVEYFKTQNTQIIPVNIGLSQNMMKQKVGDIRYINYKDENYIDEIISIIQNKK